MLYVNGVAVDWKGFQRHYTRQKVTLPTYPFQRHRYWLQETTTALKKLQKPNQEKAPKTDKIFEKLS